MPILILAEMIAQTPDPVTATYNEPRRIMGMAITTCECGHEQSSHMDGEGDCSEKIALLEKRTEDKRSYAVEMANRVSSSPEEPCDCKKFRPKR